METTWRIEAMVARNLTMQVKQHVHRNFHILSLEDPSKSNAGDQKHILQ